MPLFYGRTTEMGNNVPRRIRGGCAPAAGGPKPKFKSYEADLKAFGRGASQ
jgi:hypothetical protein